MTEEEKIAKLAEWMGWHRNRRYASWRNGENMWVADSMWNPFHHLDDVFKLQCKIAEDADLAEQFGCAIGAIVHAFDEGFTDRAYWLVANATAAQRATAVCSVLGIG